MTPESHERRRVIDAAIARSNSRPELIGHLERDGETELAESLEGKPLIQTRSPWGVLAASVLGAILGNYGFNLTPTETEALTIVCGFVGAIIMRLITRAPVNGIVRPQSV